MIIDQFSDETCSSIGHYVYRLIDPRSGNTFYVGEGCGNRVFAHVHDALGSNYLGKAESESDEKEEDEESLKLSTIRDIHRAGLEVIHVIQRWGMDRKTAFEVESALIDSFPGLSNEVLGHDHDRGITSAFELDKRFSLSEYEEPSDISYMIIKITNSRIDYKNGSIYEAVRYAWKLKCEKAKSRQYVFAVVSGVVVDVFVPERWEKVQETGRYQFFGKEAPKAILDRFVQHRIPANYSKKGQANPICYGKK